VYAIISALLLATLITWFFHYAALPLWVDEFVTVKLVTASLPHMLSAVWFGFDATPPLYTGFAWLILHAVPGINAEYLLRTTNLVETTATILVLFLLAREYLDWITAFAATLLFVAVEKTKLQTLILDIRTYATFVLFVAIAILLAIRAIKNRSLGRFVRVALCYCLVIASHIFGIIFVLCISAAAMCVVALERDWRSARNFLLATLPALALFLAWLPVVHHQSLLGNWIPKPGIGELIFACLPAPADLLLVPLTLAILVVQRQSWLTPLGQLAGRLRSLDATYIFLIVLPILCFGATLAIWVFAHLLFPVFLARYFFPNVVLHVIYLGLFAQLILVYFRSTRRQAALLAVLALFAFVSIASAPPNSNERIVPCFDDARNSFIEDGFVGGKPVIALWGHSWMTRLERPGENIIYAFDTNPDPSEIAKYPSYRYDFNYTLGFADWLHSATVDSTEDLLRKTHEFLVLDDNTGPWLNSLRQHHAAELTKLAETPTCKLWRVKLSD
jgi:hypothetical protein